eukprot:TRINITY_DN24467_c0_g2_i1.p1 TRINITY_DN24467_c0_g2~~TRINITY_DN24467_c0_g2_i1.p1  ORF type:complete len:211 (+),score=64.82 TRINITY_DN24467_c0_g2_i1:76-633(+)
MPPVAARLLGGWWRGVGDGAQGRTHEVLSLLAEPTPALTDTKSGGDAGVLRLRHESFARPIPEDAPARRTRLEQGYIAAAPRGSAEGSISSAAPAGSPDGLATAELLKCAISTNEKKRTASVSCEGLRHGLRGDGAPTARVRREMSVDGHQMQLTVSERALDGGEWRPQLRASLKRDNICWRDTY